MKLTLDEVKKFYSDIKDPGEISVGYERSYDKMFKWLTDPIIKKGLGIPGSFATKLLALTAYQISIEALELNKAWEIDRYLKDKANEFLENLAVNQQTVLDKTITNEIEEIIYDPWFITKARKHQKDAKKQKKQQRKAAKKKLKRNKKS